MRCRARSPYIIVIVKLRIFQWTGGLGAFSEHVESTNAALIYAQSSIGSVFDVCVAIIWL